MSNRAAIDVSISGVDVESRTIRGMASTISVDSHRTIIVPQGIDLRRYLKNPVFIDCHDSCEAPLGQCTEISVVPDVGLQAAFTLDADEEAEEILQKYAGGSMRGFSVGGRITQIVFGWEPESEWPGDLPEYAVKALREKTAEAVITGLELFEISACAIPSNEDSLVFRSTVSRQIAEMQALCDRFADLVERMERASDKVKCDQECPECGTECPDDAEECPECGYVFSAAKPDAEEAEKQAETTEKQAEIEPEITVDEARECLKVLFESGLLRL